AVHDTDRTSGWWPDLELTVFQDRGLDGQRWTVTGALVGTAEIWLQPFADGTVLHVFLRCDVTRRGSATEPAPISRRRALRVCRDRAWQIKQWSWALKRELEGDRAAGEPRPGAPVEEGTAQAQAPVAPSPEGAVDAPGRPR
ncbi:MAG: hypothetical protein ACRDTP_12645, partial [Mycobacteriales bacterium]